MFEDYRLSSENKKLDFRSMRNLLNIIYFGSILVFFALMLACVVFSFFPADSFFVEKIGYDYKLGVQVTENSSFYTEAKSDLLPNMSSVGYQREISPKSAFLIYFISSLGISFSAYIYGIRQIREMLITTTEEGKPFSEKNVKRLHQLGWVIILYSLLRNHIITLISIMFITRSFLLNFINISFTGLVIGFLVLCLAKIFQYGAYLQEEHDTTL